MRLLCWSNQKAFCRFINNRCNVYQEIDISEVIYFIVVVENLIRNGKSVLKNYRTVAFS